MKEQELISLGFERVEVSAEESGDEAFYYYTLDLGNQRVVSLISPADNEIVDNKWSVELFEDASISFDDIDQLKTFIKIVKDNTIK
jgi:hypothetical protein